MEQNTEIRTVQWTETTDLQGLSHTSRSSHWLRTEPPALAWRHYFDDSYDHHVQDTRGILRTNSKPDSIHLDRKHPIEINDEIAKVLAPASDASEPWATEEVVQEGRTLLRHVREEVQHNFRIVRTLLSEPDSGRLVRNETRQFDLRTGLEVMTTIGSEFVYNEPIPDDIFEIPEDLPVEASDLDALFPDLWPTLGEDDRQAIQSTIGNSDAAWLAADFRKFAREWTFQFEPNVPTKLDWSELVKKHTGLWSRWQSDVLDLTKWQGIGVRLASNVFVSQLPDDQEQEEAGTLWIKVKYVAEWADNGDLWEGDAEFYLICRRRKYRIVHWEFPLEEMKAQHLLKKSQ